MYVRVNKRVDENKTGIENIAKCIVLMAFMGQMYEGRCLFIFFYLTFVF